MSEASAPLAALELCAGGGGQAIGLEFAGFQCAAAVEIDSQACATLRLNRPGWRVIEGDIRTVNGRDFRGIDLVAAGVPCPPFSIAGRQLGPSDERDLFPEALRIVSEAKPVAVLLENVPGFASAKFLEYRREFCMRLEKLGYSTEWRLLNACDFSVPQLRPRFVLVGLQQRFFSSFCWPSPKRQTTTVGTALQDLMNANYWPGASKWVSRANGIAPTIVGGSKKHGGPDLGPTRAKLQWRQLSVDGLGIADSAPGSGFPIDGLPRLTVRMVARLQSFPDDWQFNGGKTAAYRQVGNAFPPPVAQAIAMRIRRALRGEIRPIVDELGGSERLCENPSLWLQKSREKRARSV